MSDKKAGPKELNLGLTELLARATADEAATERLGDLGTKPETAIVTLEDDIHALNAELSRLAESGEWGMLVGRAESEISSEEDIEARLWWIRGHLGAFTLPVSLLAAPFETVCRHLVGDSRLEIFAALIREIGEIALARLHDVGDRRQEHAVRLALCKLGILNAEEMAGKGYGKIPTKVPRFELGTVSVEKPVVSAALLQTARNKTWRVAGVVVALLCFVLTGVFLLRGRGLVQQPLMTAPEDLLVMNEVPGMVPPDVVGRPVSSSLGALYYSLEKDGGDVSKSSASPGSARTEENKDARKAQGGRVVTEPAREQVSARVSQSERPPAPDVQKPREVIRTDGPIEGPDFTRGVDRQGARQPRLPDLMPPTVPKPLPNLSYPDGSINLGGEIKATLVRTEVFDSPSYQARIIARLEPGDKVSVEGRVGQWLRIRSRRGRAGFVYAQDIGELENFNVDDVTQ